MTIPISALYVGILAFVSLALQMATVKTRGSVQVPIGDGGNSDLLVAMRRQLHFAETVPIALFILVVLELNGAGYWTLHILGAALVVARVLHPFGLRADRQVVPPRQIGTGVTMLVTVVGAVLLLAQSIGSLF